MAPSSSAPAPLESAESSTPPTECELFLLELHNLLGLAAFAAEARHALQAIEDLAMWQPAVKTVLRDARRRVGAWVEREEHS